MVSEGGVGLPPVSYAGGGMKIRARPEREPRSRARNSRNELLEYLICSREERGCARDLDDSLALRIVCRQFERTRIAVRGCGVVAAGG